MADPRTVVVAGSHGLIGSALVRELRNRGDRVRRLVRGEPSSNRHPHDVWWDPDAGVLPASALDGADVVVNLAGAPVGTRRWTTGYRRVILSSRVRGTSLLATRIAALDEPPVLLQASASGIYGDRGQETLTERSARGEGFLADVVAQWEAATSPATEAGARVIALRTGIVLSPEGGALAPLLPLLRLGLGGRLGSGTQMWSWITLADHISAVQHLFDSRLAGPVNLTAPAPVSNSELTAALASELRRPAVVPVPALALRLALGGFAQEILGSQDIRPTALMADGFVFQHPDITTAARWVARH